MKRRAFFAALIGSGAAQAQEYTACVPPLWSSTCKKVNGQCPVCSWMAKPFRPTIEEMSKYSPCAPLEVSEGLAFSVCRQWTKKDLPTSREVVCEKCNNNYTQYAD